MHRCAPLEIVYQSRPYCAGVRVDTWIETGTEVTPFYDSLLGKLMVFGKDRQEAVEKLQEALAHTVINGIPTNLEYHRAIAASPNFAAGAGILY